MKTPILSILASAATVFAAAGDGDWAAAYTKAEAALAQLTQAEKINLVTGVGWEKGPCVGNIAALSSIGFPALCLQDSPLGCASMRTFACGFANFMKCSVCSRGYCISFWHNNWVDMGYRAYVGARKCSW